MADDELSKASGQQMQEIGITGLHRFSGYVSEEFLKDLQGPKAAKIYREMRDNDPVIGAFMYAIERLVAQVQWHVQEPENGNAKTKEAAEFITQCMNDMRHSWADFVVEITSMFVFGYSWHEIVYKKRAGANKDPDKHSKFDDGKVGWAKIPIRAQETLLRWEFNDSGDAIGFIQLAPPDYQTVTIPRSKSLLFRTTTHKNNPEGRSLLRNAYRPWYFLKRIEEIEAIGIERDLAGFPVMYVDPRITKSDANEADKVVLANYKKLITGVRRDSEEGAVIPSIFDDKGNQLYKLTLLSTGGTRQFDTNSILIRYATRIASVVLADFILLGHDKVGSFALSSDKTDLFAVALGSMLESIKGILNTEAVPTLLELNGYKLDELPTIEYGDIESPDLAELSTFLMNLSKAGMPLFPSLNLQNHLLELANLPEQTDDEFDELTTPKGPTPEELSELRIKELEAKAKIDSANQPQVAFQANPAQAKEQAAAGGAAPATSGKDNAQAQSDAAGKAPAKTDASAVAEDKVTAQPKTKQAAAGEDKAGK
jgi:hypothetical protein